MHIGTRTRQIQMDKYYLLLFQIKYKYPKISFHNISSIEFNSCGAKDDIFPVHHINLNQLQKETLQVISLFPLKIMKTQTSCSLEKGFPVHGFLKVLFWPQLGVFVSLFFCFPAFLSYLRLFFVPLFSIFFSLFVVYFCMDVPIVWLYIHLNVAKCQSYFNFAKPSGFTPESTLSKYPVGRFSTVHTEPVTKRAVGRLPFQYLVL